MDNRITMYSTQWCGDCHRAKRVLAELGAAYVEVDIERTPGAAELVMDWANGKRVVPTITVGDRVLVNPPARLLEDVVRAGMRTKEEEMG